MSNEVMQVQKNENFEIVQNAEGKFQRKAIYQPFSSVTPETKEEKIKMMNLLEGNGESKPMNENVGAQIKLADVIFKPYTKVDEETGEIEYGVLSYLITPEGDTYVTSSKSVYHSLRNMFMIFGEPHYNEDEQVLLEVVKKPGQNFKYIDVKLIG